MQRRILGSAGDERHQRTGREHSAKRHGARDAACSVPEPWASARPACYNACVASRSQTEQQQQASVDLAELLNELANKIERLKTLYEQYFMGIEKMEPQVARKEVTRVMLTLQQQYIRNTALRF